ncbi:hypothetical protein IV203_027603 [Nitzschia inconspicua]|uniref:Uncharacterized protein n=1 Tax=Nitzschia inconspicua TaxID=303405 RepID=A0A9K3LWZ9_9STRA|nr:hypothetical protein IV203_027603 [Nitzschia inconspicua]
MKEEFARKEFECIDVQNLKFLSQKDRSWVSIHDNDHPMVIEAKHLYELTWVQRRVGVKGVPLPLVTVDDVTDPAAHEVHHHVPDAIRDLQLSQQNAATVIDQENDTRWERWIALLRSSSNLASGCRDVLDVIDTFMEEMHLEVTATVASRQGDTKKRVSEIAFPVTGRARQRVEKRKKNRGQY